MDELLRDFLQETGEHVEAAGAQLVQLERDPSDVAMIAVIFRLLHTIKGTCGFLGLSRLGKLAHHAEALLSRLRDGKPATRETVALILAAVDRIRFLLAEIELRQAEPAGSDDDLIAALQDEVARPTERAFRAAPGGVERMPAETASPRDDSKATTVRVTVASLEAMATLVSELVLARNQLAEVARRITGGDITATLARLSSIVTDLQDEVMGARMQPLDRLFATLPRLVRDLGRELGKGIELVIEGHETELDRQLIESLRDPLTHLIRNCADHGLETAADRVSLGKSPEGTIRVSAAHVAGQILIEVSDDGRGLDLPRIGVIALRRGLVDELTLAGMTADELARLIFAPGFSTAPEVTAISGRGVGLDIVRANIEGIGGEVAVMSTRGEGTGFTIRIPLTLAIAPALIVSAEGQNFALPQVDIVEIVALGDLDALHRVERVQDCDVLVLRNEILPLIDLAALLRLRASRAPAQGTVVVMFCGDRQFGLLVDDVADMPDIVVKPMGPLLGDIRLYGGHTILGDGTVVLILDPVGLGDLVGLRRRGSRRVSAPAALPVSAAARVLLFRAGTGSIKALPLAVVKRIDTMRPGDLEQSAGRLLMRQGTGLLPLVSLSDEDATGRPDQPILVVEIDGRTVGLLVDEIIDVAEAGSDIMVPSATARAHGAAVLDGRVTEIVDPDHVVRDLAVLQRPAGRALECVS